MKETAAAGRPRRRPGHQHEEQTVETIARVRVGLEAQEGIQAFFDKRPQPGAPLQGRSMTQYHPIKHLLIASFGQYNGVWINTLRTCAP